MKNLLIASALALASAGGLASTVSAQPPLPVPPSEEEACDFVDDFFPEIPCR